MHRVQFSGEFMRYATAVVSSRAGEQVIQSVLQLMMMIAVFVLVGNAVYIRLL